MVYHTLSANCRLSNVPAVGACCKFLWRDLWPLVEAVGLQPAALWHRITALVLYTCMVAADRVGASPLL